MPGSEVAAREESAVPALRTPDTSRAFDASDYVFPRLYIGQGLSPAVEAGLVNTGDLFLASGGDDTEPEVLAPSGSTDGVEFYVLDIQKGWSRSVPGGDLERWTWDEIDPAYAKANDIYRTYTLHVALPSVEDELPIKYLMSRSAAPAARKIITLLSRVADEKPTWTQKFKLVTEKRTEPHPHYVPRVSTVEANEDELPVVEKLYGIIESGLARQAEARTAAAEREAAQPAI